MSNEITVGMRLNNTIYKCGIENRFYNLKDKKAMAVTILTGLGQTAQGQMGLNLEGLIICEDCYNKNKDNKDGLNFSEPSKIVVPIGTALPHIARK